MRRSPLVATKNETALRLILDDEDGDPFICKDYLLIVDGAAEIKGKTDINGLVNEVVPPHTKRVKLILHSDDKNPNKTIKYSISIAPPNSENTSSLNKSTAIRIDEE